MSPDNEIDIRWIFCWILSGVNNYIKHEHKPGTSSDYRRSRSRRGRCTLPPPPILYSYYTRYTILDFPPPTPLSSSMLYSNALQCCTSFTPMHWETEVNSALLDCCITALHHCQRTAILHFTASTDNFCPSCYELHCLKVILHWRHCVQLDVVKK